MPNPYVEDELTRRAQVGMLREPTSGTMPVGGAPQIEPIPPVQPAPSAPSAQASIFQGFTPKHAMEGFDFGREQNTGKSAKDAFAYLSNQAPPPPLNDKAALGAWFDQYIKPGMNTLGHTVTDVQGDKFRFNNWQGDYWVDYGRGAGADGGALAWQADDANGGTPAATPQARGQNPVMDNSAITKILAELSAASNDDQSPAAREAMLQMLQGGL